MADPDFQYALQCHEQFEHETQTTTLTNQDYHLALLLQQQFEQEATTENPSSLVYHQKTRTTTTTTKSLIDPSWEIIDPTPDIHVLFVAFNERFFWSKLLTVCVSWSKRMTSCAGICSYQGRGGMCSITLSEPLLKLRPRKDLVETLLHEMIHAYLFVTDNNRDRDGHGPEFHKHMYRINSEAGTKITVYHSFHDEVRLYQQHWWRCNGPCQHRKPFFGMVRRATNRAPGPNDRWWAEHSKTCGGDFIKVKEPEKKKKASNKENKKKTSSPQKNAIVNYFPVLQNHNKKPTFSTKSNVHGFDSKGNVTKISTKDTSHKTETSVRKNSNSTIVLAKKTPQLTPTNNKKASPASTENTLRGDSTKTNDYSAVRNHWLNKYDNNNEKKRPPDEFLQKTQSKMSKQDMAACPVCNVQYELAAMDEHLDWCLEQFSSEQEEECVGCGRFFAKSELQKHVSECLSASFSDDFEEGAGYLREQKRECPLCHEKLCGDAYDIHAEKCLHNLYDDMERRLSAESISSNNVITIEDNNDSVRHEFESSCSDDESAKKYNCPLCFKMFLEEEMCDHLGVCVKDHVDKEEEQNKNVFTVDL